MATKMNPDLQKERNNATFDPEEITNILDGGKGMTERRRELGRYIYFTRMGVPIMKQIDEYEMNLRC